MSGTAPPPQAETSSARFGWLDPVGAAVSFAAPFAVALGAAGTASSWRDDAVVLRGLGWVGLGRTGCVSALLAQASLFVPIGSIHFRLAVLSAVVLGAAGYAIRAWGRDRLAHQADAPLLAGALATIAALTATLSATGQSEGAVPGASGVALLLAVTLLAAKPRDALSRPSSALYVGMLGGALAAESGVTAAVLALAVAAGLWADEQRPAPRALSFAVGGAVASWALLVSPALVRRWAPAPFLDIARAIGAMEAAVPRRPMGGVLARLGDEGPLLVALAAAGFATGLARKRVRGAIVPLVVIVFLYAASAFGEGRLFLAEDVAPLHLLATAALAVGAAVALQSIAVAILGWRLPMAKGAVILLVMTDLTLAVATAEDASFVNDRSAWRGADAFTDEALEGLPPRAALLVHSRDPALRLWAAQLAHGTRPDVLLVPVPATGDTRLALRLLRLEPALQKALQDISLDGRPGEEALTILADARPVLAELDPAWDRRVLSHFVPDHLWLRFLPEPRGPSDRKAAFSDFAARAERVLDASLVGGKPDPATASVLRARLIDGALVAALLGDRDEASALATRVGAIPGGELFAAELMQKLLASKSGPIDLKGITR